jgi:hypothetical protein
MGCGAVLLKRSRAASALMLLAAAAIFGLAVALRALESDLAFPPGALRFVAMGSFSAFAFHRAWGWIEQKLV